MAKRYKKLECGDYVRECLYSCPEPQDKPIARAEKSKATSKAQKRVNQNNSKIKLAMLIGGNFGPDDLFITPTFSPENLPATYAELQVSAPMIRGGAVFSAADTGEAAGDGV